MAAIAATSQRQTVTIHYKKNEQIIEILQAKS